MFTLAMRKSGVLLSEIFCDISRTLLTAVWVFNSPHLFYNSPPCRLMSPFPQLISQTSFLNANLIESKNTSPYNRCYKIGFHFLDTPIISGLKTKHAFDLKENTVWRKGELGEFVLNDMCGRDVCSLKRLIIIHLSSTQDRRVSLNSLTKYRLSFKFRLLNRFSMNITKA